MTFFGGRELYRRCCCAVADIERNRLLRVIGKIDDAGLPIGIGTDLELRLVQAERAKLDQRVYPRIVDRLRIGAGNVEISRAVAEIGGELWNVRGEGSGRDQHEGKQKTTHKVMVAAGREIHSATSAGALLEVESILGRSAGAKIDSSVPLPVPSGSTGAKAQLIGTTMEKLC